MAESANTKTDIQEAMKYFENAPTHYTYNNSMMAADLPLFRVFFFMMETSGKQYYSGTCNCCCALTTKSHSLKRCSGCDLVAYCDMICQKKDWKRHKIFCKAFPVKNGKNALMFEEKIRKDSIIWNDSLNKLTEKAQNLKKKTYLDTNAAIYLKFSRFLASVFTGYSRVCHICRNGKQNELFNCTCCCVAYCSKAHQQEDVIHKEYCEILTMFPLIDSLILRKRCVDLPCISENTVQTIFVPITESHFDKVKVVLVQQVEKDYPGVFNKIYPSIFSTFDLMFAFQKYLLSGPLTILMILQKFGIGKDRKPIQAMSSINIHIVTNTPVFPSYGWEYFMHLLPNLMELNISFIIPGAFAEFLEYTDATLQRCEDCKAKGRIINYSIHRRYYYHMFFSSNEYSEPDVVAVFGFVAPNFIYTEVEQENSVISFRNMTYNKDSLLILTDVTEKTLYYGLLYVEKARSTLKMISPVTKNPMAGIFGVRGTKELPIMNYKDFVCCLRNS